ncbi:MAG: sulfotransferase [Pseudomonadota bacterium]
MARASVDRVMARARQLTRRGDNAAAAAVLRQGLDRYPSNIRLKRRLDGLMAGASGGAQAELSLLAALYSKGRHGEAFAMAADLQARHDGVAEVHAIKGATAMALGRLGEAESAFARAVAVRPRDASLLASLGAVLIALGRFQDAADRLTDAVTIAPDHADAHNNLGNALKGLGRLGDAIAHFEKALTLAPRKAQTHNNLGVALTEMGDKDGAAAALRKAVALRPGYAQAYRNLAAVADFTAGAPEVAAMTALLSDPEVGDAARTHLHFALFTAFDGCGERAKAFAHLEAGNRLRKAALAYTIDADRALFRDITSAFASTPLPKVRLVAVGGVAPILVVGMPRSGTSLVEAILASHEDVTAGGERDDLRRAVAPLLAAHRKGGITEGMIVEARRQYLDALTAVSGGKPFVTDKMPQNFRWIGAVRAMVPEARIVHITRAAPAVCFSLYKHYFAVRGHGYAYDQADVAAYYRLYRDLMETWRRLNSDGVADIAYEALTQSPEAGIRRLLDACGLTFSARCLDHTRHVGAVQTVSALQVRKGIYTGSSEAWRQYEPWLTPMLQGLGDQAAAADPPKLG